MRWKKLLSAVTFLACCASPASSAVVDLWQGRNGSLDSPASSVTWTTANIGAADAHLVEGYSIPYRTVITGLSTGQHTLVIRWDVRQGGKHAIDYITHYQRLLPHDFFLDHNVAEPINPLSGVSGSFGSSNTFPIPPPSSATSPTPGQPTASFNALPQNEQELTIWNGTITNATYTSEGDLGASTASTVLSITFIATNSTVVIAWGGHIASKSDWGNTTASSGSGSPYRTRKVSLDGSGAAQDRLLNVSAIEFPPSVSVTGPSSVCVGTTNVYNVATDLPKASRTIVWSLTGNTAGAQIIGPANSTNVSVKTSSDGTFKLRAKVNSDKVQNSETVLVTVNPLTTAGPLTSQRACPGTTVEFTTVAAGAEPLTFVWTKDGEVMDGATSGTLVLTNVSITNAGLYCVQVNGVCGSVTQCATLDVEIPPTVTCPPTVTVECLDQVPLPDPGLVVFTGGTITATAEHFTDLIATNGCEIDITRTYQITDECGAITYCNQLIRVVDTTPPVLTCAGDFVVECGTPWNFEAPTATDNCLGTNVFVEITGTVTNQTCGNTFIAIRTWKAWDNCTNISTCSQTVTIIDTTAPLIFCASNFVVECGTPWNFETPTAQDICDDTNVLIEIVDTITNSTCGNTFIATRTWKATDSCSNFSTCSQTVTIVDTTPPLIFCASNFVVECSFPWNFETPTAQDICDDTNVLIEIIGTETNATCGNTFITTRTWKATDSCSNFSTCSQTVTVVDTTPPVLTCFGSRIVECGDYWEFDPPTATDLCDDTNLVIEIIGTITNQLIGETFEATRTWRATDSCSNYSECSQTVTIIDTTPPAIFCSSNIVVECAGPPGTVVTFEVTAFDGCDSNVVLVCTPPSGTMFALGTNTVICTATDDSTNVSQCTFTVTVIDTTPPDIVCTTNMIFEESPRDSGFAPVTFAPPIITDVCDATPTSGSSPVSGSNFEVGYTTVTSFAADESGNTNTCSFIVRVIPYRLFVTTTNDSGPGSLREALLDANAASEENLIQFDIPGASPHRIELLSALPEITSPVIIDGWSQSGFSGKPVIEINGSQTGGPVDGLVFATGSNTVRGLVLNGFAKALVLGAGDSSIVQGNYIGTDTTGTNFVGNSGDGIFITSAGNRIGGTNAAARNVIAGNLGNGVHLATSNALGNLVQGNFIGLAANGVSPLGNGSNGVFFADSAAFNSVTSSNTIAANGANGVAMSSAAGNGNAVFGNRIFGNTLIGIDLGANGPTPNDSGDTDEGPNRLQNRPVLQDAQSADGFTVIKGTLNSLPNRFYRLEFYLNITTNALGQSEGRSIIGSSSVLVPASGNGDFNLSFPLAATAVQFVTATAMDPDGNSSEFSLPKQVRTPPVLDSVPESVSTGVGSNVTMCATVSGTPPIQYQWRLNGQNIPGATNFCYTIPAAQVNNGGSYTVVVGNDLGAVGTFPSTLSLNVPPLAGGDNFADAVLFTGTNGLVSGANTNATREPGEPNHAGKPGGKSVWYKWKAPSTGIATVGTSGSTFDTLLGVYTRKETWQTVSNLDVVASDEDRGGYFTSGIRFNAIKQETYYVAIDGYSGESGQYVFTWQHEKTAKLLPVIGTGPLSQTVLPGATVGFNVIAFRVCSLGHVECPDRTHYPSEKIPRKFYQWLRDGIAIPKATNTVYNITNVQAGLVGEYSVQVTVNGQTVESDPAFLQINLTAGVAQNTQTKDKFQDAFTAPPLQLGTFTEPVPAGAPGMGLLAAPAAVVVRGYSGSQVFNTTKSTSQGEIFCGVIGGSSEWLSFVPGETGLLSLNTDGSSFHTLIALVASNIPPQIIQCDSGSTNRTNSSIVAPVEAGKFYLIGIDGLNGTSGRVVLNYSLNTPGPQATSQSVTGPEEGTILITLTGSDADGPLTTNYSVVVNPTNGVLSGLNAQSGAVTYTATNVNYVGTDRFSFVRDDGSLTSAVAVVTITLTNVNDAPLANNQALTRAEDSAFAITLTGSDVDGPLTNYAVVALPTNGVLSGTAPNLTYRGNTNYFGPDSFSFVRSDGSLTSSVAVVTITLTNVNDAPLASGQTLTRAEDSAFAITLTGSDSDGPLTHYVVRVNPTNGVLSGLDINSGVVTYTATNVNYFGPDRFSFVRDDGSLTSAVAVVTITLTNVNDAPVANNQALTRAEDSTFAITLTGSDVDGPLTNYAVVALPTNGVLSGTAPNLTYRGNTNYFGPDSLSFVRGDGSLTSSVAVVTITLTNVNDAPLASSQSVTGAEDGTILITLTGSDVDGPLTNYVVSINPTNGVLSGLNAQSGAVTYTATNANYFGPDSFRFVRSDGSLTSSVAVVTITLTNVIEASLPAPQLVPLPRTNDLFRFRVLSISSPFVILVSTNLTSWDPLSTNEAPPGVFDYTDPLSTNFNRRFYNIKLVE